MTGASNDWPLHCLPLQLLLLLLMAPHLLSRRHSVPLDRLRCRIIPVELCGAENVILRPLLFSVEWRAVNCSPEQDANNDHDNTQQSCY